MVDFKERLKRLQRVKSLLASGASLQEIANALGVTKRTVANDVKLIKQNILDELKKEPLEKLLFEISIQTDETLRQYWRMYTTAENENVKLGALNGICRLLSEKIYMLERLGVIEHVDKVEYTGKVDISVLKKYLDEHAGEGRTHNHNG